MKRLIGWVSAAALLVCAPAVRSQELLVPAGTLLQCTLDEPNFSSKTAAVGDPVLCHLRTLQEFGKPVFPRGSMLGGHLEAEKDPGHFVGKGYLKITFDRVILPNGDVPVPAKVIQARGYKVDKQGDIDGKGHPKRDVVEWMIPPLWPWKVVSLPLRGPYPTLKGEEPMQLRLMDDIVIPQHVAQVTGMRLDRSPSAIIVRPSAYDRPPTASAPATPATTIAPTAPAKPVATPNADGAMRLIAQQTANPAVANSSSVPGSQSGNGAQSSEKYTILVLKSNQALEVVKYRRDGDALAYQDTQGRAGSVAVKDVDWAKTSEMTAEVRSVDTLAVSGQTH